MRFRTLLIAWMAAISFPARCEPATKSTDPKVEARLIAIESEIQRRGQTNPRAAELLASDLQRVRDLLSGKRAPAAPNAPPEIHVVGMYGPAHWRKNEIVEVTESDRPIVLVVCAYDPVRWEIKIAKGANVRKVLVGGYEEQKLSFADPAQVVPVEMHTHAAQGRDWFYADRKETGQYANLAATLKRLANQDVTTFQGAHKGTGGPYIVGPGSPAWRAQVIDDELEPLYREATAIQRAVPFEDKPTTFPAVYLNTDPTPARVAPNGRRLPEPPPIPMLMPRVRADFTPRGPIRDSFIPLTGRVIQVAVDPNGSVYGIDAHEVGRIDPTGNFVPINVKGDVPKVSWLCGLAFDTRRQRLVITDFGGVGYMLAYAPQKDEWTYITEMNNIDLGGLAYSPLDDCFFGIEPDRGDDNSEIKIHQFDPAGKLLKTCSLSEKVATDREPGCGLQLAMCGEQGDKIAIVTSPVVLDQKNRVFENGRCIVADPKTGEVILSRKMRPWVSQSADFAADDVHRLWRLVGGEGAEASDAANRLVAGGDRAVEALKPWLDPPTEPASDAQLNTWIGQLSDPDAKVREHATSDLIHAGAAVETRIRHATKGDLPPEAQSRLAVVLQEIAEPGPGARVRRMSRIINILEEIGSPAAIERLIELSPSISEARLALRRI